MITITAFPWVPSFARGQVRDLRVRWALEEAGLPYKTRLLEHGEGTSRDRALQPFGQVPIFMEDDFVLFESGAIVLHIGQRSDVLLPTKPAARTRATQWLIAALNSIEPFVMNVAAIDAFYADQEWAKLRRPGAEAFLRQRLASLSNALGDKPYLDGEQFTAGDLMMATVLRILGHTDIVASEPAKPYLERFARAAIPAGAGCATGGFPAGGGPSRQCPQWGASRVRLLSPPQKWWSG
jgi:glutathione S-transferase